MGTIKENVKASAIAGNKESQITWLTDELSEFLDEFKIDPSAERSAMEFLDVLGLIHKFSLTVHSIGTTLTNVKDVWSHEGSFQQYTTSFDIEKYLDAWNQSQIARGREAMPISSFVRAKALFIAALEKLVEKNVKFAFMPSLWMVKMDDIKSLSKLAEKKLFLVAPSGAGKSYILDQLNGTDLDDFGSLRYRGDANLWVVDTNKFYNHFRMMSTDQYVIGGTCDNLQSVLTIARPDYVVFIYTDPESFRQIRALKFVDAKEEGEAPDQWLKYFQESSEYSDDEVVAYQSEKRDEYYQLFLQMGKDDSYFALYENILLTPPTKGWHKRK